MNVQPYSTVVQIEHLSKRFGAVQALQDVSFDLRRGEIHGLVGENGAGKSTFVNILSGLIRRDQGRVVILGKPYAHLDPSTANEAGVEIIPQKLSAVPQLSIAENLYLNRWPRRGRLVDWATMRSGASELLSRVGISIDPSTKMGGLSYVEQQLIEITKTFFVRRAKIIILDEPTGPLVGQEIQRLNGFIKRFREEQSVSFIYISHFLNEIFDICDRATVFRDGRTVMTRDVVELTMRDLVSAMVGEGVDLYPPRDAEIGEPLLEVRDLRRRPQVERVTFTLRRGEILGIAGLKGAGRTELLRAISGLDRPEAGEILLRSRALGRSSYRRSLDGGVGLLPEDRLQWGLFPQRSVKENITISSLRTVTGRLGLIRGRAERQIVDGLIDRLEIRTAGRDAQVATLSGGNQQKVVFSKLLGLDLVVYLLDEPTLGVDVKAKSQIHRIMNSLVEAGNAILLVSSDVSELAAMSDRVLVLGDGVIQRELTGAEVTDSLIRSLLEEDEG